MAARFSQKLDKRRNSGELALRGVRLPQCTSGDAVYCGGAREAHHQENLYETDFLGFRERDVHGVLRCVPWSGRERYRPGGGRAENTSARPNHIGQAEPRWKIPKG